MLKIKVAFPFFKTTNIDNIQKIIKSDNNPITKPQINMTTKGLLHKQVIVPMSEINQKNLMKESEAYVTNLNRALKSIKLDISVNFIHSDASSIIMVTNKVANPSDLQTIKNYIKGASLINSNKIDSLRLPQSKSYLKIIGLLYLQEDSTNPLSLNVVEKIIKDNHIFNNITLVSKPCIIKVSLKSDIAIVWIDIWDVQSKKNTKALINRCFNMGSYIATICGANMNPGVPQCKNCWKWGHSTFLCHIQEAKCIYLTNWNTTVNLYGAVKQMKKQILHDWKQRRVNHIPTLSSAQIVKIIKQTLLSALSGGQIQPQLV